MSCSTYRTLSIRYDEPEIAPANGYVIKWRIAGDLTYNTVSSLYGNPLQITNIPTCYNIEGTVQADCGGGNLGTPVNFAVSGTSVGCYNFELLETRTYTFTPCNQTAPISVFNNASDPLVDRTVCALDGTVTGGIFTRGTSCTTYP
jgi:hypothetical protein